ncbi:Xaa-Pro aminopeptidase [uncultured Paraglaciecola sp.]|uniref:Xaa-Pro aminopeptidase n=1 Tax=uncultured Paraglaciecola sp. TaxID=1765024 RepID=UPI00261FA9A9|nr:Xaa-Pro aminopeptidase [uncultured Paraglaciecola sp.]
MPLDNTEFLTRQKHVLQSMQPNSIAIVPASSLVTRSSDTEYPFRQDSYFHYLCGFPEPDAWLLLTNHQRYSNGMGILFCLDKDPTMEIWHGRRIGPKQAKGDYGVDLTFAVDELEQRLEDIIDGHQHLYFAAGHNRHADEVVSTALQSLRNAPKQSKQAPASSIDLRLILDEMRLIKSAAEIDLMRRAAAISTQAHIRATKFATSAKNEYHLEAEIHHEFAMQGAKYPAYGTIVGAGDNSCILHYTENNQELKDGDLVLIDAGCEWQGYASDITRTFPVSGQFSVAQKQLYQLVLDAQLAAFEVIKPNNTIAQASETAIAVITQGLLELGILQGELADNIERLTYREFYMHGLSHWLGLDVHDVGHYKVDGQDRPLLAGMVLTVEPGIYIAPDADVESKWRGIGIRIEDNLLITSNGFENLTEAAPKTIDAIEALMKKSH